MIDLNEAKSIIEHKFEGSKVQAAYQYDKKYYLLVAPSGENDNNDPFYIVDIGTGKYRFLNPLEDIDKFNESIENGPIKVFDVDKTIE